MVVSPVCMKRIQLSRDGSGAKHSPSFAEGLHKSYRRLSRTDGILHDAANHSWYDSGLEMPTPPMPHALALAISLPAHWTLKHKALSFVIT